ncbi:MAG: MoxR family ATPase [Spirochaetales bacterium]|nr:MoxR family ATPase [Spirochaetales bacterium]
MKERVEGHERVESILASLRAGMAQRIVGQEELVNGILTACIAGGHVLLEGVPGLAKTLAVKTFSELCNLSFRRIQFTPDLLPSDLVGTLVFESASSSFSVRKGPVFANLVLADEINRAPAKVQSALLEAMAERQVTIGETSYSLPDPFFVLATQNPIEQEGTYSLPEAELDRFLLKLHIPYPSPQEECTVVQQTIDGNRGANRLDAMLSPADLAFLQKALSQVRCDPSLVSYIVSLCAASRPLVDPRKAKKPREDYLKYLSFGASPRASIGLCLTARIQALFEGRSYVIPEDIKTMAYPVLRHRLVLSYEAGADGLTADDIIGRILSLIALP